MMTTELETPDVDTTAQDVARLLDQAAAEPELRVSVLTKLLGEGACRQIGIFPLPPGFKLSVVIPVFNEERWLAELVRRVQVVPIPKELILVNDFSTDGTPAILKKLEEQYDNIRVFHQPKNMGKGAACGRGSNTAPAIWSSFRTRTGSTTPPSSRS